MTPDDVQTEILTDIFGKRVDEMLLTGLVDSEMISIDLLNTLFKNGSFTTSKKHRVQ